VSHGSAPGFKIGRAITGIAACVLLSALGLCAQDDHQGEQMFRGKITDSSNTCPGLGGQAAILDRGETPAQCTIAKVKKGAKYALLDPDAKTVYLLEDQKAPEAFAGQDVIIIGTLDKPKNTIHVDGMVRSFPAKVMKAKTVAIVCDACPRGMAAARLAAFERLALWGRFNVIPDPRKADLIFLFSANPYLGDYVTRDGPDKRPVAVDITYMDVLDPTTGASLWSGSQELGSWFVARATKDLIDDFREQLALQESSVEPPSPPDKQPAPQ
jgi:hypothetical protein